MRDQSACCELRLPAQPVLARQRHLFPPKKNVSPATKEIYGTRWLRPSASPLYH
jgi:hypothetical protein